MPEPISEFFKNRSRKGGLSAYCKKCDKACATRYYQTPKGRTVGRANLRKYNQSTKGHASQKRYRKTHKQEIRARDAMTTATKRGKIPRAKLFKCQQCGEQAEQYHHPNYAPEHRLDVIPLCRKCHNSIHRATQEYAL